MIVCWYMYLFGVISWDFGVVLVVDCKYVVNNFKVYFYGKLIIIEDYQNLRWIVELLWLLDCCQEIDGVVVIVLMLVVCVWDFKQCLVVIEVVVQGCSLDQYMMVSYYWLEFDGLFEMGLVGWQLWVQLGLMLVDVQIVVFYDYFMLFILIQLEELGFCGKGEVKDFIVDGVIEVGGWLFINIYGG